MNHRAMNGFNHDSPKLRHHYLSRTELTPTERQGFLQVNPKWESASDKQIIKEINHRNKTLKTNDLPLNEASSSH
jgi:porphobilinogen deaminase